MNFLENFNYQLSNSLCTGVKSILSLKSIPMVARIPTTLLTISNSMANGSSKSQTALTYSDAYGTLNPVSNKYAA